MNYKYFLQPANLRSRAYHTEATKNFGS